MTGDRCKRRYVTPSGRLRFAGRADDDDGDVTRYTWSVCARRLTDVRCRWSCNVQLFCSINDATFCRCVTASSCRTHGGDDWQTDGLVSWFRLVLCLEAARLTVEIYYRGVYWFHSTMTTWWVTSFSPAVNKLPTEKSCVKYIWLFLKLLWNHYVTERFHIRLHAQSLFVFIHYTAEASNKIKLEALGNQCVCMTIRSDLKDFFCPKISSSFSIVLIDPYSREGWFVGTSYKYTATHHIGNNRHKTKWIMLRLITHM